jgi:hypothetical protein
MSRTGDSVRMSIQKRMEALDHFKKKREEFLLAREEIIKDIEAARQIWRETLEQLPNQEFK